MTQSLTPRLIYNVRYIYIYIYKGSEAECGVGLGEMCVIEYRIVCFTHCLVYLVVFNNDPSTSGSTRFAVLIVYNMCA